MYSYEIYEWIIFFAVYCLIGWIGESLYVSWEHKKWVNRGFLHGPFLPIYGSGAIIILFATLPVRNNPVLVFLFGMLSASILEYFTGYIMEQIFKVRYWDYTVQPFNLNGYICLGCSIAWGVCALLLIYLIHRPIENLVIRIDRISGTVTAFVFSLYFVTDMVMSGKEAFDLRKLIIEAIEHNENIKRLQKRFDVAVAFINDDIEKIHDNITLKKEEISAEIATSKEKLLERLESKKIYSAYRMLKRNPNSKIRRHDIEIDHIKDIIKEKIRDRIKDNTRK